MSLATDPVPSSPDSLTELGAGNRAKKRRVAAIVLVVIPVALGAGGYLLYKQNEAREEREIHDAWRQATGCLAGVALEAGQKPSLRFHRIQLEAARVEKDPSQPNWPERCADPVAAVNTVLRSHARIDGAFGELAAEADKLAPLLRKAGQLSDLSAPVDAFYLAAGKAGLDAKEVAAPAQPPPEPKDAFDVDSLPKTALISPLQYTTESLSTTFLVGPDLHLMIYDTHIDPKPIVCTFTAAGPEVACRRVAGEAAGKPGLALEGTADPGALPLLVVGQHGSEGVYRVDSGERIGVSEVTAAYVAKDGYLAVVGRVDSESGAFKLVQQAAPGAKLERATIEPKDVDADAKQIHRLNVLWNKLVVQIIPEDTDKPPRLQFLELPARKNPLAQFKDLGAANWVNAPLFGCRSGDALVVRLGADQGYLDFFADARWSKLLPVDGFGGGEMTCDGAEAVMGSAREQRCNSAGCKNVDPPAAKIEPFQASSAERVDLNGKPLVVAATDGGVRYHAGAGGEYQLLYDDHVKDGAVVAESTRVGSKLYGRGRFAVLMLSTPAGLFALYVDAGGKAWPAKITWAG